MLRSCGRVFLSVSVMRLWMRLVQTFTVDSSPGSLFHVCLVTEVDGRPVGVGLPAYIYTHN
jgi:hypothetical protein